MILAARIASLTSIGISTMRLPVVTSAILAKAPAGSAFSGHGISRSAERGEFVAEPQRPAGDHDRARRRVRRFCCASRLFMRCVRLVVEPGLRQEDREQSEQDCKADHDESTAYASPTPVDAIIILVCSRRLLSAGQC